MACPDERQFCACIHTNYVDLNDVVEIVMVDGGSGQGFKPRLNLDVYNSSHFRLTIKQENHPIHLHGFSFAVLGSEKVLNQSINLQEN